MATIELKQVEKKFGDFSAVQPMDLTIKSGEFVVLLGPSGCGKTTTLRMISGLEAVTGGHIYLDGRDVTWLHPSQRDIAFVFQFFALYPHMTARENIVFPLQAQGESHETIEKRLAGVVDMLKIEHLLSSRPGHLSGGDQQRVALARALVRHPAAFLMDEPLGALDAELRESMRAEIKRLHIVNEATSVYVTHDQVEAMAMGDRIVVMSDAVVQQVGTPEDVYHKPSNLFVARFIGSPGMNLVHGKYTDGTVYVSGDNRYQVPDVWKPVLAELLTGDDIVLGFRPEGAHVAEKGELTGCVYADDMHGAFTMLALEMGDDIISIRSSRDESHPMGCDTRFNLDPEMVRFFDPKTGLALRRRDVQ